MDSPHCDAVLYDRLPENEVRCRLCPRRCVVPPGDAGFCVLRHNEGGTLRTYRGLVVSMAATQMEMYGLFHFYPSGRFLEVNMPFCHVRCHFCAARPLRLEDLYI